MRKRSFVATTALLLAAFTSIRADQRPPAPTSKTPFEALWSFNTHG